MDDAAKVYLKVLLVNINNHYPPRLVDDRAKQPVSKYKPI